MSVSYARQHSFCLMPFPILPVCTSYVCDHTFCSYAFPCSKWVCPGVCLPAVLASMIVDLPRCLGGGSECEQFYKVYSS